MEREDDELALSELLVSLWQYKKTLLICVLFGVVLALLAWISTPVTTGVTYRLSIYPDGAPMYSRDAIAAQLTSALSSAGYSPSRARDGTITVKTFGADDGSQIVSTAMTISATLNASARKAVATAGADCGEFCVRLTAWADAQDAAYFEMISISSQPFRNDMRLIMALLGFVGPLICAVLALLAAAAVRSVRRAVEETRKMTKLPEVSQSGARRSYYVLHSLACVRFLVGRVPMRLVRALAALGCRDWCRSLTRVRPGDAAAAPAIAVRTAMCWREKIDLIKFLQPFPAPRSPISSCADPGAHAALAQDQRRARARLAGVTRRH